MDRGSGTDRGIGRRTRRPLALGLPIAFLSMAACTDFGTGFRMTDPGGMSVVAREFGLEAENRSAARMHHFLVAQDIIPVIDWAPFCNEENAIEAGTTVNVPYDRVMGYSKGCIVVVYWWHPVRVNGGAAKADSIRVIHIKTP